MILYIHCLFVFTFYLCLFGNLQFYIFKGNISLSFNICLIELKSGFFAGGFFCLPGLFCSLHVIVSPCIIYTENIVFFCVSGVFAIFIMQKCTILVYFRSGYFPPKLAIYNV